MFRDKDSTIINVGDTVLLDNGCICLIKDFMVYEVAVELLLEDKLTHNFKTEQPRNVRKIS